MRYSLNYRDIEELMNERGVDVDHSSVQRWVVKYTGMLEDAFKAALEEYNAENNTSIEIRQVKYVNNIVEQDYRGTKRIVRPMLNFKEFYSASVTLGGIELVRMIRKGQLKNQKNIGQNPAEIFYSLAA